MYYVTSLLKNSFRFSVLLLCRHTSAVKQAFFLHRWALLAEGLYCCAWFQQLEEMQRQEQQLSEQHHLSMRQNNGELWCAACAVSQRCLWTDCGICKAVCFLPPSCCAGRNYIDGKLDIIMRQSKSRCGWSYSKWALMDTWTSCIDWLVIIVYLLFFVLKFVPIYIDFFVLMHSFKI